VLALGGPHSNDLGHRPDDAQKALAEIAADGQSFVDAQNRHALGGSLSTILGQRSLDAQTRNAEIAAAGHNDDDAHSASACGGTYTMTHASTNERANAGRSEGSWIKHSLLSKIVEAQVRTAHLHDKLLLIDANAGDGIGVLHDGVVSTPTPQIVTNIAFAVSADVCLCDASRRQRLLLRKRFPSALIAETHSDVVDVVRAGGYDYVLWLSDPCGYTGHGVGAMRIVARDVAASDFIVVFNEGSVLRRINHAARRQKIYGELQHASFWLQQLQKNYLARTSVINQSRGFRYRVLVVSNELSDAAHRPPFSEIFRVTI
jgi:hypothetical protein